MRFLVPIVCVFVAMNVGAQQPSPRSGTLIQLIKLDCRGTLLIFSGEWRTSETEALVTIYPDDKRVTYAGAMFDGTYAISRMDEDEVMFGLGPTGSYTASANLSRHTGTLIINTTDFQRSAQLNCKPAKTLF
jgi:hypothetical protein